MKTRWNELSNKSNLLILSERFIFLKFVIDRIVGIRSLHAFDVISTGEVKCQSVSTSVNSKTFHFKQQSNSDFHLAVKRILDPEDYKNSIFLIVDLNHTLHLAQINRADLKTNQIQISIFSPPLPVKTLSTSKSSLVFLSSNNVIGRLIDAPTQTTKNQIAHSDEQFISIQDLCDEF